jgi:hypothetical protein
MALVYTGEDKMAVIKFRVEDGLKHLMQDEEFRRRIVRAYEVQVEANHGWGFTVRYEGYRIRFDINDRASSAAVTVYVGYAEEEPKSIQQNLLEVLG